MARSVTPGVILDGGELGYSLATAYGAEPFKMSQSRRNY